jgi:hypothetical protein
MPNGRRDFSCGWNLAKAGESWWSKVLMCIIWKAGANVAGEFLGAYFVRKYKVTKKYCTVRSTLDIFVFAQVTDAKLSYSTFNFPPKATSERKAFFPGQRMFRSEKHPLLDAKQRS